MKKTIILMVFLSLLCGNFLHAAELSPQTNDLLNKWANEDSAQRKKALHRLGELNVILHKRAALALDYAVEVEETQVTSRNAKELYGTGYGGVIVSSNIFHLVSINEHIMALIVMQAGGSNGDENSAFSLSRKSFEIYMNTSFNLNFETIKTMLIFCQEQLPEPISTIAKDTLRDFEECKTLIMSISPVQSKQ